MVSFQEHYHGPPLIDSFQGATATATPPVVTTGTANPPYNITTEKDQNATLQFYAISCMPQYIGYSAEVSVTATAILNF